MPASPLRAFIVEDHPDSADSLVRLLTLDGVCQAVGVAATEREALSWSFHNEAGFDLAIVDLLLRDGSGFTVLTHLAKYQPGTIVVLSDFVTPVIAERCVKLGASAAFAKSQISECIQYVRSMATRRGESSPPDPAPR